MPAKRTGPEFGSLFNVGCESLLYLLHSFPPCSSLSPLAVNQSYRLLIRSSIWYPPPLSAVPVTVCGVKLWLVNVQNFSLVFLCLFQCWPVPPSMIGNLLIEGFPLILSIVELTACCTNIHSNFTAAYISSHFTGTQ